MTDAVGRKSQPTEETRPTGGLTLGEACETLGLPPSTFRQIIGEFEDLLDQADEDEGAVAMLSPAVMERLRSIVQWRNQGVPVQEIRARLQGAPLAAGSSAAELQDHERLLVEQLERMNRELQKSEERRVEDRDRMLTAMMRTQQEIQHLRYSLTLSSRKDRKKRGFLSRLFG